MPRRSESNTSRRVIAWLRKMPSTVARKRRAVGGLKGMPDVTACSHGILLELEGKVPGGRVSPKQEFYIRQFQAAGAISGVYYSLADVQRMVYFGMKERGIVLDPALFSEIRGEIE